MQLNNLQSPRTQQSDLDTLKAYILRNLVKVQPGRKCIDGRYLPDQASGMIARPGGDCGYVMALLAVNKRKSLGLTPEQCFNAVYKVVSRGSDGHFCMHTDHHVDPNSHTHNGLIGCGHVAKAAVDSLCGEYDVDSTDIERFVNYARNIADIMPTLNVINLKGEHKEEGVLIINSDKFTVNPEDETNDKMFFIYDMQRDIKYLKYIADQITIPGVNFAELKKESDLQLAATLHNLAKGLPIYTVDFENNTPRITFDSFVQ